MSSNLEIGSNVLGRGQYGLVYDGRLSGTKVAVKKVEMARFKTDDLSLREEEIMKCLNHPNVIKLISIEILGEFKCFVMELCAASLDNFYKNKYSGPVPSKLNGLLDIARAVDYIHSQNFVHRDLKPANVLISLPNDSGATSLKISDFGFSKLTSQSGSFSMSGVWGSQNFMAPEILKLSDKEMEGRERMQVTSDIFSMGCLFYGFLTKGKHPFGSGFTIPVNILSSQFNLSGNFQLIFKFCFLFT